MSMECFTLNWGLNVYFWLVSEFAGVRYGRLVAPLGFVVTFCTLAHLITSSFLEFWDLLCPAVYFNNSSKDHLIISWYLEERVWWWPINTKLPFDKDCSSIIVLIYVIWICVDNLTLKSFSQFFVFILSLVFLVSAGTNNDDCYHYYSDKQLTWVTFSLISAMIVMMVVMLLSVAWGTWIIVWGSLIVWRTWIVMPIWVILNICRWLCWTCWRIVVWRTRIIMPIWVVFNVCRGYCWATTWASA